MDKQQQVMQIGKVVGGQILNSMTFLIWPVDDAVSLPMNDRSVSLL